MKSDIRIGINGHLKITEDDTKKVLLDKNNAIHPQNMARIIARALAKEDNGYIYRIAFGNGGTVTDPMEVVTFNEVNDGRNGSWEARLYNETYSEVVDESDVNFGYDLGSAELGNIRTGGGSLPEDDAAGGGVRSEEVGLKSNVVITMFMNKNEPTGQFASMSSFGVEVDDTEKAFVFDEIGLYSSGLPATATSGYSSVNVGNKTSDDVSLLAASTSYSATMIIDSVEYTTTFTTPAGGSGPAGAFTYGDICEGINSGDWYDSGDDITAYVHVFITDHSGGAYPTIENEESYGLLTFKSKTTGATSSVDLVCDAENLSELPDLFVAITNNTCASVGYDTAVGKNSGVINDSNDQSNERERLLTHIIFPPITKTADKALNIVYTLTISVAYTSDSRGEQTISGSSIEFP